MLTLYSPRAIIVVLATQNSVAVFFINESNTLLFFLTLFCKLYFEDSFYLNDFVTMCCSCLRSFIN